MVKESAQESKTPTNIDVEQLLEKIVKALDGLQYGEVIIKVQGGKVIWVDRHERERVG